MKSPNAPPRAKPITPLIAVLPTQDSMAVCIWDFSMLVGEVEWVVCRKELTVRTIWASCSFMPAVELGKGVGGRRLPAGLDVFPPPPPPPPAPGKFILLLGI